MYDCAHGISMAKTKLTLGCFLNQSISVLNTVLKTVLAIPFPQTVPH